MSPDILDRPVIVVELTLADDDTTLRREWSMDDQIPEVVGIEPWMVYPRRSWPHPQDPITFTAMVLPDDRETAEQWLAAL